MKYNKDRIIKRQVHCSVCHKKLLDVVTYQADILVKCPHCKSLCRMDIKDNGVFYYDEMVETSSLVAESKSTYGK